jgi:hypothetical protein
VADALLSSPEGSVNLWLFSPDSVDPGPASLSRLFSVLSIAPPDDCKCRSNSEETSSMSSNTPKGNRNAVHSSRLTSIDSWPELLQKPDNTDVIRYNQNWLARLATSAVYVKKYGDTMILPDRASVLEIFTANILVEHEE